MTRITESKNLASFCLNPLPKTNGAISQKTNTTEIEKTLGIESKKKFDSKKAYSPIELIESFKKYQSYPTIQLAFKHAAISLAQGANYEIPYSTESNRAFILIAQAIANHIVGKRANKNANPIEIANKVYSSDGKNNRNNPYDITKANQEQDGYRFRGRGIKQLTHRYNYADFQSYYNKHYPNDTKDFLNNEEHRKALLDNGKIALLSAVWFWNDKKCYKIADKQTSNNANEIVKQITKKVNGGYNGLDEEQKDFHIKISPSKTIQPKDKKTKELLEQRLSFEKNIPKAITLNDNIKPNIKVISIECKDIKYTHNNANTQVKAKSNTPHNITMNNTSIKSHHTNNTIESITLKAHYVLKDSQKATIQGDECSCL